MAKAQTPAEIEGRARIIAEAISWVRTPFHDDARLKGIGVDCAQLVAGVYLDAGVVPAFEIPRYTAQWFMHRSEEKLLDFVSRFGREIPESDVRPGDLAIYKIARAYAHAAIIVDWPSEIIHAHMPSRMVVRASPRGGDLHGAPIKFFSLWT